MQPLLLRSLMKMITKLHDQGLSTEYRALRAHKNEYELRHGMSRERQRSLGGRSRCFARYVRFHIVGP